MAKKKIESPDDLVNGVIDSDGILISVQATIETITTISWLCYRAGHLGKNLSQPLRAKALRIAMDTHDVVRKRDRSLAEFLDNEADYCRKRKQTAEGGARK